VMHYSMKRGLSHNAMLLARISRTSKSNYINLLRSPLNASRRELTVPLCVALEQ